MKNLPNGRAVVIPLTKGMFTIVDATDFEFLNQWKWTFDRYAVRTAWNKGKPKRIYLHRLLLPTNLEIDHINGDKLDNRRENLRVCTTQQNQFNSKTKNKYKGVHWDKQRGKWIARIVFNGKDIHLGRYEDPKKAALNYNKKAQELFGKFARLNRV